MGSRKRKQQAVLDADEEEERRQLLLVLQAAEDEDQSSDDDDDSSDEDDGSNDVPLMEDAKGIDDNVRRKLRREERALGKAIQEETVSYQDGRDKNNELFQKVVYTREAVLDGENVKFLAEKAAKNAQNIMQVARYDADRLVAKLAQKCQSTKSTGSSFFDWEILGIEAGLCFNAVPSRASFLNGLLQSDHQVKVRKQAAKRTRLRDEEGEVARPSVVRQGDDDGDAADRLSAVEKSMTKLSKVLKDRVAQEYIKRKAECLENLGEKEIPLRVQKKLEKIGNNVNGVQFLFNPKSFTQTVENIFHFSFLVRNGQAKIGVQDKKNLDELPFSSESGLIVSTGFNGSEGDAALKRKEPRQVIANFTMSDWRRMCAAYGVTERGDIPHREGSKQAKRQRTGDESSSQQSFSQGT